MAVIRKPYRDYKLGPPRPKPQQRALAQWRGIDLAPVEESRTLRAGRVGDLMPKVLTKLGIERRQGEAEILKVWNNLIDPRIAAHAQPTGLHKGTLFVTVDNSVWLSEIVRYRRREILDRLQHGFGRDVIARISFRVG
jgi:predicted nucleic acid-binding Zn ribbon protein